MDEQELNNILNNVKIPNYELNNFRYNVYIPPSEQHKYIPYELYKKELDDNKILKDVLNSLEIKNLLIKSQQQLIDCLYNRIKRLENK